MVTRKLTHVFAGSSMLTLFYLFPVGHSRAGRLAVALFLCSFVAVFSLAAHIPEEELEALVEAEAEEEPLELALALDLLPLASWQRPQVARQ